MVQVLEPAGEWDRSNNFYCRSVQNGLQVEGCLLTGGVIRIGDLLGIVVQPLDLHLVNEGSISTGPTHDKV